MKQLNSSLPYRVFGTLFFFVMSVAMLSVTASAAPADPTLDPRSEGLSAPEKVEVLLNRVKGEQEKIETLTARFTQTQDSEFLIEAEESQGRFYYEAPDHVLWEYQSPDPISVLIDKGTMTSWYKDLGRAERLHVGKQSEKALKYMGAGGSMSALEEYFDVAAAFPKDVTLPYRLELTPRYDTIARRLQGITLWIDPVSFLPLRLQYIDGDGGVTDFQFEEMVVNSELSDEQFELEMPEDVEVKVVDLNSGS